MTSMISKLMGWFFNKPEPQNVTFEDLKIGDEFERDQKLYVKISPISYCESEPINSYTSLQWRLVSENFPVIKV